ncbi:MAG: SRPBCC family protein [Acidobacteria bacterium]|nr:SRPBCC family protein [Acidobacteriota bacterium]
MVVSTAANSDSFKVTTPSDHEIRMTRLFDAPRHLVFEALTKPEHVRQWWGRLGEGYSVPVCEIDLRVGGKWRFVNRHPRGEVAFHGEYMEITPPSRLVYTELMEPHAEPAAVVTSILTEEHGKTRLTATMRLPSLEARDMILGTGMERGAGISYDRLEDLVAQLQRS